MLLESCEQQKQAVNTVLMLGSIKNAETFACVSVNNHEYQSYSSVLIFQYCVRPLSALSSLCDSHKLLASFLSISFVKFVNLG